MTELVEVGKARAAGVLSILIAVTAVMNLTCSIIYNEKSGFSGSRIWTGAGLAVCAGFGLITWSKRSNIAMVGFAVLSILWFIVCVTGMISTLLQWKIYHIIRRVLEKNCQLVDNCEIYKARMIKRCLLGILVLDSLGAAFLLAGSIVGCIVTCCSNRTVGHTNSAVLGHSGLVKHSISKMPAQDYTMNVEKL